MTDIFMLIYVKSCVYVQRSDSETFGERGNINEQVVQAESNGGA